MAKYDNTGDKKRRRFPVFLTILIIGIVLMVVGAVLIQITNTKSLGKRYSYDENFDGGSIANIDIDFAAGAINIKKAAMKISTSQARISLKSSTLPHLTENFRSRLPTAFCILTADMFPLTAVNLS